MSSVSTMRATDAFCRGVGVAPVMSSESPIWGGLTVCDWKLPWLDGFELAENDDFVIAYHSDGSPRVRAACNGPWSQTTSTPGLISVIPPGRRVEYVIDGEVGFSTVHVPGKLLEGLIECSAGARPDFRFAFEDMFASSCMQILLGEARAQHTSDFPYMHAVMRALLLHLMKAFAEDDRMNPWSEEAFDVDDDSGRKLDAMLDFIEANLAGVLSLNHLADRVGVSRAHFARRFRTLTGMSPHRYITLRRVERAKRLLHESRENLAQIALESGFGNQSHFTQVFHAVTGHTPSQYRRRPDSLAN